MAVARRPAAGSQMLGDQKSCDFRITGVSLVEFVCND